MPEHATEPCTLPRRWRFRTGTVIACPGCHTLYRAGWIDLMMDGSVRGWIRLTPHTTDPDTMHMITDPSPTDPPGRKWWQGIAPDTGPGEPLVIHTSDPSPRVVNPEVLHGAGVLFMPFDLRGCGDPACPEAPLGDEPRAGHPLPPLPSLAHLLSRAHRTAACRCYEAPKIATTRGPRR